MAILRFTPHLKMHLSCEDGVFTGATVRAVLDAACERDPRLRGYVLDDQGALRKHVTVFVNGVVIRDRAAQADAVKDEDEICLFQLLSGG